MWKAFAGWKGDYCSKLMEHPFPRSRWVEYWRCIRTCVRLLSFYCWRTGDRGNSRLVWSNVLFVFAGRNFSDAPRTMELGLFLIRFVYWIVCPFPCWWIIVDGKKSHYFKHVRGWFSCCSFSHDDNTKLHFSFVCFPNAVITIHYLTETRTLANTVFSLGSVCV